MKIGVIQNLLRLHHLNFLADIILFNIIIIVEVTLMSIILVVTIITLLLLQHDFLGLALNDAINVHFHSKAVHLLFLIVLPDTGQ